MKTTIQEQENQLVAIFEGRLDTSAATEVEKDLTPLNNCEGRDIVLDCTALEYVSSSGLRIFLGILKMAKSKGSKVSILGANSYLMEVLNMTGFTRLFDIR